MIHIHEKTLQDLEFSTVLRQISEHCITQLGNEKALQITPFQTKELLLNNLQLTNEYLASFYNDNRIPNHGFDAI
jgi:DNA mismatch repair protein MutS2